MKSLMLVLAAILISNGAFAGNLVGKCSREGNTVSVEVQGTKMITREYGSLAAAINASGSCALKAQQLACDSENQLIDGNEVSSHTSLTACAVSLAVSAINGLQPGDKNWLLMQLAKPTKL